MSELCDEARTRGVDGTVDWARLEVEAGKMIESGLELADRIEAVQDINRIPGFWAPGRLASDRALHQLSRHYPERLINKRADPTKSNMLYQVCRAAI